MRTQAHFVEKLQRRPAMLRSMATDDEKRRGERLRRAAGLMGFTRPKDVIEAFHRQGVKSSYYQHQAGSVGYSFKYATLYGELFGVSPEWLYSGTGHMLPPSRDSAGLDVVSFAPLLTMVSAGKLFAGEQIEELREAKRVGAPGLDPSGNWIALQVEGDSMDRISPPGSIIFVNRRDQTLVSNGCYVFRDTETGEMSYKRWRPSPNRLEPFSTNADHEPIFLPEGREPAVLGRVRRSILEM